MPRKKPVKKVRAIRDLENEQSPKDSTQANNIQEQHRSLIEERALLQINSKNVTCCSVNRCNWFTTFIFIAGILVGLFQPEIFGMDMPPCPPDQGLHNGRCVTYCNIDNFVNKLTNITFKQALAKCRLNCEGGMIWDTQKERCYSQDQIFENNSKHLATLKTSGQLIDSLSQNITCKGEQFTTPFQSRELEDKGLHLVRFKTKQYSFQIERGRYEYQMLLTFENLVKLNKFVNTTDSKSIQCSEIWGTKGCPRQWERQLNYIFWYDYYDSYGKWQSQEFGQMIDGWLSGFYRTVTSTKTMVGWKSEIKTDSKSGKTLEYRYGQCYRYYYHYGPSLWTWSGNDLATQYGTS